MSLFARVKQFVPRRAQEPGGFGYILRSGTDGPGPLKMPADAAGYNVLMDGSFEWVTWQQIIDRRREWQRDRLEQIRRAPWEIREYVARPAQVWVFDNGDIFPFGGWWCYIRTLSGDRSTRPPTSYVCRGGAKGSVTAESPLALHLMRILPMGVLPSASNFDTWMAELARTCPKQPRRGSSRREGYVNGWTDGHTFELKREDLI